MRPYYEHAGIARSGAVTVAGTTTSVTKLIDYDSFYIANPGR